MENKIAETPIAETPTLEAQPAEALAAETLTTDALISDAPTSEIPTVDLMRKSVNHIFLWLLLYNGFVLLVAFGFNILLPEVDEYLSTLIATVLGTALIYLCTLKKWPVRPFAKSKKKMSTKDFFTLFGVFGITQLITFCVSLLTDAMGVEGTSLELGPISFVLFIYAVLLGPLAEELVYRGFSIGNGRILGKIPAIILAAFAFGLMHGNLLQFVIGLLGGIVLGFIFAEYSIWWSLLIHVINNAVGVGLSMLPLEYADLAGMSYYVILILFGIYGIIQVIKRRDEVKAWFADEDNKGTEGAIRSILTSPWFIVFTVIYIAMIVLLMVFPGMAALPEMAQ